MIGSRKVVSVETTSAGPFRVGLAVLNATSLALGEPVDTIYWLENVSAESWEVVNEPEPVYLLFEKSDRSGQTPGSGLVTLVHPGEVLLRESDFTHNIAGTIPVRAGTNAEIRSTNRPSNRRSLAATTSPITITLE